jgi:raffinose/stachyose/melibiose transport system substrate-binding protein
MFTACNGKETTGGDAGMQIELFSMYEVGEDHIDYFTEIAKRFEEETGIHVKLTFCGRGVLDELSDRIKSGNPPELVDQEFSELIAALLTNGADLALPLDDFLYNTPGPEGQDRLIDIFNETFMNIYMVDGKHYFFPYELTTAGFSYNKTMFSDYGLKAPETWSEFIALNEALKAEGVPPLALDGNISFYNAYYYVYLCLRILGTGSFLEAAEDKTGAAWDDPGYLEAAQLAYELSESGKNFFQPGYAESNFPAAQANWALGKSGSIMCGTWIPQETWELVDDNWKFGCFSFPEIEGGVGNTTEIEASLYGFSVLKGSKNPDAAKEFLKYVARKENSQKYVTYTGLISPRKDVAPPTMLADVREMLANATGYFLPYDGVLGNHPEWLTTVFYPLDNKLIFGEITPNEFISQIKQNSINYWNKK